ncbi:GMC family oxidoreductase [Acetobacter papayae]|uniref:GMC family oxidoreductase n=1 Tax=Acetobacter papayae TaxID=1076592 RepID=UPI0039ED6997
MKARVMPDTETDIVIVGAGASGCVVAGYLAEHTDARITLLEAGGADKDPMIKIPAGYAKLLEHDRHLWKYDTVPQYGTPRPYRSGKVMGGGSSVNALCYVRGQKRDYDEWNDAVEGAEDWSYEEMLKHFVAQECSDTFHNAYHGASGDMKIELTRHINPLNQLCVKAFQEYGLPYNVDYNGESQIGVSPVQTNIHNGRRCNAVDAYLRRHLKSGRVKAVTGVTVTRVLIREGEAYGVEYLASGRKHRVLARQVVLSAGAVQSPKILMHSGVGPQAELSKFGIPVKVDAPDVGENLQDHPICCVRTYVRDKLGYQDICSGLGAAKAGLRYLLTRDGPIAGNGIETVSHWNPQDFTADPTVQCYHVPVISEDGLIPTGKRPGVTLEVVLLRPRSRGWVRLADANPDSMPLINPNFMEDEQDLSDAVAAIRAARLVMAQDSLAQVTEEELAPGAAVQSDEEIAQWIRKVVNTMWHPVGTCRMGSDDRAVVDARLRVKGVENLRVIDASIMPNIVSANTNAPCQALARKGAVMLAEDYARQ